MTMTVDKKDKKKESRKTLTTAHDNFFIDHGMCEFLKDNGSGSFEQWYDKFYQMVS